MLRNLGGYENENNCNRNAAGYGVCAVSQSDVPVRFR